MIQLQLVFLGIKYLVTDPSFGMGQKCFTLIDGKCKQATASIIFVWDFSQFPPVSDKILYHPYPTSDIAPQGFCHAKVLKTDVQLGKNQCGNSLVTYSTLF